MAGASEGEEGGRILLVDDEEGIRQVLGMVLSGEGWQVVQASSGEEALARYATGGFDLVLEDLKMPGTDGIEVLRRIKESYPEALVIIMTAFSTWDSAVEAMRLGAFDYIKKPFDNDQVRAIVGRALEFKRHLDAYDEADESRREFKPLIGNSASIMEIHSRVRRIAATDSTVLLLGESGTGKDLVARTIHVRSHRRLSTFISTNCGALTESLLESELFGHVKGAFTGATADKMGLLEVADGGTLFLDEVGDMSPAIQVKLLRVLEERKIMRVGDTAPRSVDVRFIAATNRNLAREVEAGNFRADLFYRLNVIPIELPPLRSRRDDILLLAGHFLSVYARKMNKGVTGIGREAMQRLVTYDWPGNVRELENVIQAALTMAEPPEIRARDLSDRLSGHGAVVAGRPPALPDEGFSLDNHIAEIEKSFIKAALERTRGHQTNAARLLGMTFRSFRYKVKKYGLR